MRILKKLSTFSALSALAIGLFFAACPSPTDPTGGGLTGEVSFLKTANDSSRTGIRISGTGTATPALTLTVQERSVTYFAAAKEAAQTITVGGTHAALVTSGTADGSTASDELAVFAVDTSAFDLMFTGGSRAFTLTVAEPEKESITVNVTLTVETEKTGAAVYRVTRSGEGDLPTYANGSPAKAEEWAVTGSLERIRGIKDYDVPTNTFGENAGGDLVDALAWVDRYAQSDEEYLIRVEESMGIPNVCLTFADQERVTLRLRGDGGEKVLKHNNLSTLSSKTNILRNKSLDTMVGVMQSIFILRPLKTDVATDIGHSLHLEAGITFDGLGTARSSNDNHQNLLELGVNSRLVLLAGSKITNSNSLGTYTILPVVFTNIDNQYEQSFYMYGGEITGNYLRNSTQNAPVRFTTAASSYAVHPVFFKYGGSIMGNYKYNTTTSDNKVCFYNAVTAIEPDTVYELPVITE